MLEAASVQLVVARRGWWIVAGVVAAAAGCGGRAATSSDVDSSAPSALAHVNGAVLDSAPRPAPATLPTAARANGVAANESAVATRSSESSTGDAGLDGAAAGGNGATEAGRSAASSAAVASTPDELSALAASLVVPVAGVTPAELHSSFTASRGGGTRQHNALDIPAPRGTPVISATAGRVLRLYNSKAGGIMVYATDPTERFILMYGHLDHYAAGMKDGMPLARGQTIGYVGTTGNAPPNVPHLHFAISRTTDVKRWWTGTPIDPAPLLKR